MENLDDINEILRLAGLPLLEAAPSAKRLLPMFQNLIKIEPSLQKTVEQEIAWSRRVLEREDRVIWHLRYLQIAMMDVVAFELQRSDPQIADAVGASAEKKTKQLAMKAGVTTEQIKAAANDVLYKSEFKTDMAHYMGMPVPAIQNHTFQYEIPIFLFRQFDEASKEWMDDQDRVVDLDEDAEIVIDFGNGVAWWNLLKPYCPIEGDCMGHCGNSPRENTDDTILSLRKEFPTEEGMKYSCMATFILTENGMLTEMKGRGNQRPAPRYHKYIVSNSSMRSHHSPDRRTSLKKHGKLENMKRRQMN